MFQFFLQKIWYRENFYKYLFMPLSWAFHVCLILRRKAYQIGLFKIYKAKCPVVVIGNITVGGTGKTPITIWLANYFILKGYKPLILSRGYGGKIGDHPIEVSRNTDVSMVGDEPLLMASKLKCPIIVHPSRIQSLIYIDDRKFDLILCDDGLQHYQLDRDFEIAVIDGDRKFGNKCLLPAGPLREPISRLSEVDISLINNSNQESIKGNSFNLVGKKVINVRTNEVRLIEDFEGHEVHAVAGIGNPDRFFNFLEKRKIIVKRHPFEDHYNYDSLELEFNDGLDILMTEKDMVKCKNFNNKKIWYVPVEVEFVKSDMKWLSDIEELVRKA